MRDLYQVLRYVKANSVIFRKEVKYEPKVIAFVLDTLAIAYNLPAIDVHNLYADVEV